jgi:cyclopropane-fatty-acyl-phospholipid synthase
MNSSLQNALAPASTRLPAAAPPAARAALQLLERLAHGKLLLQLPDGSSQRFGDGQGPSAQMHLHNWNVCAAALKAGDIGFAESYIAGDWSSPDVCALLELFIANRREIEDVIYGSWWGRAAYRVKHWLNRNTKRNSQKNIHAHYDLGNAFYSLWLDETMNYSSAWFSPGTQDDMPGAQRAKVRRALRMAAVKPGDRVLEIGCGWGGLVETGRAGHGRHAVGAATGVCASTFGPFASAVAPARLPRLERRAL